MHVIDVAHELEGGVTHRAEHALMRSAKHVVDKMCPEYTERVPMPCMWWVKPGCVEQVEERGQWDVRRCRVCHNGGAWGFGQCH